MGRRTVAPRRAEGPGRGAGERSEPLGTTADKPSDREDRRRGSRREALEWRSRLWELTSLPRVKNCGRVAHSASGGAVIRVSETDQGRRAGISGLQSCGSVWACPVCARKVGSERSEEVARVLRAVAAQRGSAALVTLTMRHSRGDLLSDLWNALTTAWGAVVSGGGYVKDQATFGILGWVRTVEVTHGPAGWHVHIHAVVALDGPTSPEMMDEMGGRMHDRWERKLRRLGHESVAEKGGLDVRPVRMTGESIEQVAGYIAKITAEITAPTTKEGRNGNRSPFAILRDGLATGNADDLDLWFVWEKVSAGRKQLTWSNQLRKWAGLHREKSDEEIAAQDKGGESVLVLPKQTWIVVRTEVADLLDAVELGGVPAGERWLRSRGLTYLTPERGRE